MTGEEIVQGNDVTLRRVHDCVFHLNTKLQHIEAIVASWVTETTYKIPDNIRRGEAEQFCGYIRNFEVIIEADLRTRGEFERLIHSQSQKDWLRLQGITLPALRTEMLDWINEMLFSLRTLPSPLWSDLLPKDFADQVLPLFRTQQYLSAVRRGCDALRSLIRNKTGLHHLDGADLINQAYGKDRPFVVGAWEGHSAEDIQRGYTDMLRGAMMGIRNPHYHGTEELPEAEAARLLVTLGTLWARAESTTSVNRAE